MTRRALLIVLAIGQIGTLSCGYHVGGKADLVPKNIQTISVPTFRTFTTRYKLADAIPQEIARELMTQARFRIEDDPSVADAVLNGSINTIGAGPAVTDPTTGKATSIRVTIALTITLLERKTGHVLYSQPNLVFGENYDIAVDPHQFFDESGTAFDRLSRDVAHTVVSGILENF